MQLMGHAKISSNSSDLGTFGQNAFLFNLPIISLIFWKFAWCDFI